MKKTGITVLSASVGVVVGVIAVGKAALKKNNEIRSMSEKHLSLFQMMNQWVRIKQEGKNLEEFFKQKGYKKIAIYGMSYAGETLVNELKNSDIDIVYGIDKNADAIYADMNVVTMEDALEKVDAVVVTAITFFDEIERMLSERMDCPIISLEDILYDI